MCALASSDWALSTVFAGITKPQPKFDELYPKFEVCMGFLFVLICRVSLLGIDSRVPLPISLEHDNDPLSAQGLARFAIPLTVLAYDFSILVFFQEHKGILDNFFFVKDVGVNSILAAGWGVLADLAMEMGDSALAAECRSAAGFPHRCLTRFGGRCFLLALPNSVSQQPS